MFCCSEDLYCARDCRRPGTNTNIIVKHFHCIDASFVSCIMIPHRPYLSATLRLDLPHQVTSPFCIYLFKYPQTAYMQLDKSSVTISVRK